MSSNAYPQCPNEGCDGNLHREIQTGLTRSTAQLLRLGGLTLLIGPLLLVAPNLYQYAVRRVVSVAGLLFTIFMLVVPPIVGVMMLRYRSQRLAERTEQQRCNRCGTVFPAAPAGGG